MVEEIYRVRVRGIYATALASILMENGYILADLSQVLQSRINRPSVDAPPHVTVKNTDDRDHLLIVGYPWDAGSSVASTLLGELGDVVELKGRYGLNTVVNAVSLGDCRLLLPGGNEAILRARDCPGKDEPVRVTIIKDRLKPGDKIIAEPVVRVVGEYVVVSYPGRGVSFSEHVRDEEKRLELASTVAQLVDLERFHVRFRSSSRLGEPGDVAKEAVRLASEARQLGEEEPGEPSIVKRGEYVSLLLLSLPAKEVMDKHRARITPTVRYHHTLKSSGQDASLLVDYAEYLLINASLDHDKLGVHTISFMAERLNGRTLRIIHRKPDGSEYLLTPGRVVSVETRINKPPVVTLKRVLRSRGILDGLNVEKQPGDYSITRYDMGSWSIVNEYYSRKGHFYGVYVNIATPPEFSPDSIRYIDLYIDVVQRPGQEPRVIDEEELEKAYEGGLIGDSLYKRAKEEAERALRRLLSNPY